MSNSNQNPKQNFWMKNGKTTQTATTQTSKNFNLEGLSKQINDKLENYINSHDKVNPAQFIELPPENIIGETIKENQQHAKKLLDDLKLAIIFNDTTNLNNSSIIHISDLEKILN